MQYKALVGGLMDLSLSFEWRPLIRSSLCSGLACHRLVRRNYSLLGVELDDTAAQLTSAADQIVAIPDDATDPVAAAEIVTKVEQQLGPITLLINDAGRATRSCGCARRRLAAEFRQKNHARGVRLHRRQFGTLIRGKAHSSGNMA